MNQKLIDVSIIATAHRPENWLEVCNSFVTNLNIEFVFVGPNPPTCQLPPNFRYIYSIVKPAQCVEIAIRNASGTYLMIFADDLILENPYGLDELVSAWCEEKNDFAIASCRYRQYDIAQSDSMLRFIDGDLSTPIMPIAGLMLKSSLDKIGGVDKRFIAVSYDLDLAMRFYANRGYAFLNDVFVHEKLELRRDSRLFRENWQHDRDLVNSLWFEDGKIRKFRNGEVLSFSTERISECSQGPRGHWRGQGAPMIEGFQNFPYRFKRLFMLMREREFAALRPTYRWIKKILTGKFFTSSQN